MPLPTFDKYWLQARLSPAVLVILPVVVAVALLLPASLSVSLPIGGIIGAALALALSDVARHLGRRAEVRLYRKWGGKPTAQFLRHADQTLNSVSKARYRDFLEKQVGSRWPTAAEEQADLATSDQYYESCAAWLRENTRDTAAFPVVFNELITYGFRRNLFGLKWIGLGLDLLTLIGCAVAFSTGTPPDLQDGEGGKYLLVAGVTLLHGFYLGFFVTAERVKEAGQLYARQLILSCEKLIENVSAIGPVSQNAGA